MAYPRHIYYETTYGISSDGKSDSSFTIPNGLCVCSEMDWSGEDMTKAHHSKCPSEKGLAAAEHYIDTVEPLVLPAISPSPHTRMVGAHINCRQCGSNTEIESEIPADRTHFYGCCSACGYMHSFPV